MRAALLALVLAALAAAPAEARTVWLCKPGLRANPCELPRDTARHAPDGRLLGVDEPAQRRRRIDCFYVYPTVSGQPTPAANRRKDPEVRSIARFQAARFGSTCRVFAPVYRQITIAGLGSGATDALRRRAYRDVRAAWRTYLRRHNRGRGVVLIGHSQGTFHLRRLLRRVIEPRWAQRRRIVSALLLGGNVAETDFVRFRRCRDEEQLRCVVAFSTYGEPAPPDAVFGRGGAICTHPASLGGGEAPVTPILPREPFAPGTAIAVLIELTGFASPASPATWLSFPGAYRARCVDEGGTHVLRITPAPGAPALAPAPARSWGLHIADANIALGELETLVRRQAAAYLRLR